MSHSNAEFRFPDGVVLYGEYDGTSDIMLPVMYRTTDERNGNWRKQVWRECDCGRPPVDCEAYSDYGDGFSWPGKACLSCMVFIGPKDPPDECF